MPNGSQPTKINRSITVHSSPQPSNIHKEGKKILPTPAKCQRNDCSFETHDVSGFHRAKQLFLLLTYRPHGDLWLAEKEINI